MAVNARDEQIIRVTVCMLTAKARDEQIMRVTVCMLSPIPPLYTMVFAAT